MTIEQAARDRLDNAHRYPGMETLTPSELRIWRYPALHAWCSWSLLRAGDAAVVRRVVWDRRVEPAATEPVTYGAEAALPAHVVAALRDELRALVLPPFIPVSALGIDGEITGVEHGDRWCRTRLAWWCDAPPEWRPLAAWVERARATFESLLPRRTV